MLNVYETVRSGLFFNKFELGDLLFVEYNCPVAEQFLPIWTPCDYVIHVLTGKKAWRSLNQSWTAEAGQSFYIKKGAYLIEQFFEEEFCMLLFFVTDDFICDTVRLHAGIPKPPLNHAKQQVIEIHHNVLLASFFQSMLSYFAQKERPTESLLRLKFRELLLHVLQSSENQPLANYLRSRHRGERPVISEVMDQHFCFNLKLTEFAQLTGRSLSAFKRDFRQQYGMSPGKWIRERRLAYAASLLQSCDLNVTEVSLQCGFEHISVFSRTFKQATGMTPSQFRKLSESSKN